MPTVPRRDQSVGGLAPLPNVRQSPDAPAAAFGTARAIPLDGLERHVSDIVEREQQKADQIAVMDADNKLASLTDTTLYDPKSGLLSRRGKDAFTAPEDFNASWQKGVSDIQSGLTNDRQMLAFQRQAQGRYQSAHETVQRHVAGESEAYDKETTNAALTNALNGALKDPTSAQFAVAKTTALVNDFAKRNGWSPDMTAERRDGAVSRVHASIVEQLLNQGNDLAASKYYETTKEQIIGTQRGPIEKALEEGSVRGESQRQADSIVAKAKGMPDALDAVRKITNSKVRDATDTRVRQYFTEQKAAMEERRQANYQTATNLVEQFRDVDKVAAKMGYAWQSFTVGERSELRSYAQKLIKGEPIQTDWARYYDLMSLASSDATKQQFLRVNLLSDRSNLSDAEFKQLTEIQTSLRKDDGKAAQQLGGYQTVSEVVERSLREAGKDVAKAKPGSDEQRDIALFRRSVDVQLQALEAKTGKKATDADAQRIVDNLLVKGTVLGTGGMFSSGQQKSVYERAPGERLVLSAKDIPVLERQRIETALRANRLPVSDAAVLKLYLKKIGTIPTLAPPKE